MTLDQLKTEATKYTFDNLEALSLKITELKDNGVSFLGCIAFVQTNKNISLKKAQLLTISLDAYSLAEKEKFNTMYRLMLDDFND